MLLSLFLNVWNKDLMAGARAADLDYEVNVGKDGVYYLLLQNNKMDGA